MSIAAIVVSYRTGPALGGCLAALKAARGVEQIVLVDNGNPPAETALLDAFAAAEPRALLLRGQGNVGYAAASNMGAARAQLPVLAFVNPDVTLAPEALSQLAEALPAQAPAVVGGDLRDEAGRPERGSRRDRLTLWRAVTSFTQLSRLEPLAPRLLRDFNRHTDPLPDGPVRVGAVSGALMVMRRADFEHLGGFDAGYFLHVEDLDLCRRIEEAGGAVVFAPGPHGAHARSTSDVPRAAIARHKARSMSRYLRKFARGPLERALASAAGALLAAHARLAGR